MSRRSRRRLALDQALLAARMLLRQSETRAALAALSERYGVHLSTLYRRLLKLGLSRMDARLGPAAVQLWRRHVRNAQRLAQNNRKLALVLTGRLRQFEQEVRQVEQQAYSVRQVARRLHMKEATLRFYADDLGYLPRRPDGRILGKDVRRFVEQHSDLLTAAQIIRKAGTLASHPPKGEST